MRVLFLGREDSAVLAHLRRVEDDVLATTEPLTADGLRKLAPDFAVSHGYRHILRRDVLDELPDRVINLHIAFLPWNRGADPNLWSLVEGTPAGVTIHYVDEGVDTGDVIARKRVRLGGGQTLRTSYDRLQAELASLFEREWPAIRAGTCSRSKQPPGGSFHRASDGAEVLASLPDGWDTPVELVRALARRSRRAG